MWLERGLVAAIWTLRLIREQARDFCRKLAAIWGLEAWSDELPHDEHASPLARRASATLCSPQRTYWLETKLAAGDLCDVYLATAADGRYVVKAPRVASSAADAVMRKEMQVLRRLSQADRDRRYVWSWPQPVESFVTPEGGPRYNVLAWEEGFYTAGEIATRHPAGLEGRHLAWMFKRMLAVLGFVHRQGWIHGAVTPPHLLFHVENHGLRLGGWIHAVRCGEPVRLAPAAYRDWYPPEAKVGAAPATDIYLAAKSLVYLAGGDPLGDVIPDHVPRLMRSFLQACLLESPRMRPSDAWTLHEELDDLLAELYGPPRYIALEMDGPR